MSYLKYDDLDHDQYNPHSPDRFIFLVPVLNSIFYSGYKYVYPKLGICSKQLHALTNAKRFEFSKDALSCTIKAAVDDDDPD